MPPKESTTAQKTLWWILGVLAALLISIAGFASSRFALRLDSVSVISSAHTAAISKLDAQQSETDRRLGRIEEKLDQILDRLPRPQ